MRSVHTTKFFSFVFEIYIIIKIYIVRRLVIRKKISCISAFFILILLLSSCNSGISTDKELVKSVVDNYYSALSNKEWDLAKSYCVDESDSYNSVIAVEENVNNWSTECNNVTLNFSPDILKVDDIDGYNALASGFLTIVITCDDREPYEEIEHFTIGLQKNSYSWKLLVIDFSSSEAE